MNTVQSAVGAAAPDALPVPPMQSQAQSAAADIIKAQVMDADATPKAGCFSCFFGSFFFPVLCQAITLSSGTCMQMWCYPSLSSLMGALDAGKAQQLQGQIPSAQKLQGQIPQGADPQAPQMALLATADDQMKERAEAAKEQAEARHA